MWSRRPEARADPGWQYQQRRRASGRARQDAAEYPQLMIRLGYRTRTKKHGGARKQPCRKQEARRYAYEADEWPVAEENLGVLEATRDAGR